MTVPWKPKTYPQVIPYVVVDDAGGLMDFLKTVFEGTEAERVVGPDGHVQHGEIRVGESMVMCGRARAPSDRTAAMVYVYVPDVDAAYARAVAAGATSIRPPTDEFYGDRSGGVKDAWGNQWWMATHKETLTPEEVARRAAQRT